MKDYLSELWLMGILTLAIIVLAVYMANLESNKAKVCRDKGGVLVKANSSRMCVKLEVL